MCSDPEMLIRQASRQSESESQNPLALQLKALDEKKQAESLKNPTPVMQALIQRMEDREAERQQMSWQQQLHHLTVRQLVLFKLKLNDYAHFQVRAKNDTLKRSNNVHLSVKI